VGYSPDGNGYIQELSGHQTILSIPYLTIVPSGINDNGEITGTVTVSFSGAVHGFFRDQSGSFTLFDAPGATSTTAKAINSHGEVTGYFTSTNPTNPALTITSGFTRSRQGQFSVFGTLFGDPCDPLPTAINDNGDVAGTCRYKTSLRWAKDTTQEGPTMHPDVVQVFVDTAGFIRYDHTILYPYPAMVLFDQVNSSESQFQTGPDDTHIALFIDAGYSPGILPSVRTHVTGINADGAVSGYTDVFGGRGARYGFVRDPWGHFVAPFPYYHFWSVISDIACAINRYGEVLGSSIIYQPRQPYADYVVHALITSRECGVINDQGIGASALGYFYF
jgi:hypothetical protein